MGEVGVGGGGGGGGGGKGRDRQCHRLTGGKRNATPDRRGAMCNVHYTTGTFELEGDKSDQDVRSQGGNI